MFIKGFFLKKVWPYVTMHMISVEEHFIIKSGLRWQVYGAPIYLLMFTYKIQTLINIALIHSRG